jgi:hypothetical protein
MNANDNSVIVYTSPWDRDVKEFWYEHSDYILYGLLIVVAFGIVFSLKKR